MYRVRMQVSGYIEVVVNTATAAEAIVAGEGIILAKGDAQDLVVFTGSEDPTVEEVK